MLAQINPFIAGEVAYLRREEVISHFPRQRDYPVEKREPRVRRHLVPRVVRWALAGH